MWHLIVLLAPESCSMYRARSKFWARPLIKYESQSTRKLTLQPGVQRPHSHPFPQGFSYGVLEFLRPNINYITNEVHENRIKTPKSSTRNECSYRDGDIKRKNTQQHTSQCPHAKININKTPEYKDPQSQTNIRKQQTPFQKNDM